MPTQSRFRFRCRDKIEPNLQSQNVRRTFPKLMESRFQRDQQSTANRRLVNAIRQISAIFLLECNSFRFSNLLLAPATWVVNCGALTQNSLRIEKKATGPNIYAYSIAVVTLMLSSRRLRAES
jgi:hypothetical protein